MVDGNEPDGTPTSARLITKGAVTVGHGCVEARIRVPAGQGVWPECGEIDVMEVVGSEPRTVHGTLHGPGDAGVEHGIGTAHGADVPSGAWRFEHEFYLLLNLAIGGPWPGKPGGGAAPTRDDARRLGARQRGGAVVRRTTRRSSSCSVSGPSSSPATTSSSRSRPRRPLS